MTLENRIGELEKRAGPDAAGRILVLATDADRARLAALAGGRVHVLAAPTDQALIQADRARGVTVLAQFVNLDLERGI